jgi:transcriptional regulator with XRE-family HTH domain
MAHHSLLFPRAIRSAREKRQWTQAELAQRMEVSQSTISFWERGLEKPTLEHQVKLVTLMPEVFERLAEQELDFLNRLYQLERAVHGGKCRCQECGCAG